MRRLAVVALVVGLLGSGVALGAGGEPKKQLNPADQARARAMLLKKADLGPLFHAVPTGSGGDIKFNCSALDESDLTITGEADSPNFTYGLAFVSSEAQVYKSVEDGAAAFKRDTSRAGITCLKSVVRREFAKEGLRLVSLRKLAFPNVSQKTAAYRIVLSGESQGVTVTVMLDAIVLLRSRAEVSLAIGSALAPAAKALEVRLARTLAARMATAMRRA